MLESGRQIRGFMRAINKPARRDVTSFGPAFAAFVAREPIAEE